MVILEETLFQLRIEFEECAKDPTETWEVLVSCRVSEAGRQHAQVLYSLPIHRHFLIRAPCFLILAINKYIFGVPPIPFLYTILGS